MFNIIIVHDFGHIEGGAGRTALSSAIGLAESGFNVTLLCAVPPIMPELLENKIKVICLGQYDIASDPNRIRAAIQGCWNIKAAKRMRELIETFDPNNTIIHIHGWSKTLSPSIIKGIISKRFNIVYTWHEYLSICPNGAFYNFQKNCNCGLSPLSLQCIFTNCDLRKYSHKIWRAFRLIIGSAYNILPKNLDNFIIQAEHNKTILMPFFSKSKKKQNYYVVKPPINISKDEPANVGEYNAFMALGRLSPEKGCFLFAEAAKRLGCKATFIGDGYCRDRISSIYPRATITGWASKSEVKNYLRQARALVFPSLWYETFGLVVLEAAALGVPAIVPDTSAATELVINDVTGLHFKGGNIDDLVNKIKMLQDPRLAKKLGKAAYEQYWSNPLTLGKHVKDLEKVYKKILFG